MHKLTAYLKSIEACGQFLLNRKIEPTKFFLPGLHYRINPPKKYNAYQIRSLWAGFLNKTYGNNQNRRLKLFLNVPFCKTRCNFCFYYLRSCSGKDLRLFVKRTCDEMDFFKKTFSGVLFQKLEIRGGSPSLLNQGQLERLLDRIDSNFSFSHSTASIKSFECNPVEASAGKFQLLKKHRFTDISFGVQSLNRNLLKHINRTYQTYNSVKNAIHMAHDYGLRVKIDLIVGLKGGSADIFLDDFEKIAKLGPESIALNPLHPTFSYIEKYYGGNEACFYSNLEAKVSEIVQSVRQLSDKYGYRYDKKIYIHRWQCLGFSKNTPKSIGELPYSVFGIGDNSNSKLFSTARYQNMPSNKRIFNPLQNNYDFYPSSIADEMRDFIFDRISRGSDVDIEECGRLFGRDSLKVFSRTFFILNELKKIKIANGRIRFNFANSQETFSYCLLFFNHQELQRIIRVSRDEKAYCE